MNTNLTTEKIANNPPKWIADRKVWADVVTSRALTTYGSAVSIYKAFVVKHNLMTQATLQF